MAQRRGCVDNHGMRIATVAVIAVAVVAARAEVRTTAPQALSPSVAPESRPSFNVVSVKESPPPVMTASGGVSIMMGIGPRPGGRWIAQNATLLRLIQESYGGFSLPGQIVGAPSWGSTTRFEVNASADGDPAREVLNEMVKTMLAERFKLEVHVESRELDVYALVFARRDGVLGRGIRPSTVDCDAVAKAGQGAGRPAPGQRPQCGSTGQIGADGTQRLTAGGTTLATVAGTAQRAAGRPVVDRTGLTGRFDIDLEFASEVRAARGVQPADSNAPSIFTALQEQLGL